MILLLLNLGKK